jgi:hypothetical protein
MQIFIESLKCMVKFSFQIGTGVTNAIIKARKTVSKDDAGEVENIPIVSTSIAYGVYMAVSSNLRYKQYFNYYHRVIYKFT